MATKLNVTIADLVFAEIEVKRKGKNRSEFVEELIRVGLKWNKQIDGSSEKEIWSEEDLKKGGIV